MARGQKKQGRRRKEQGRGREAPFFFVPISPSVTPRAPPWNPRAPPLSSRAQRAIPSHLERDDERRPLALGRSKLISEDLRINLENVKWEELGTCRKVTIANDDTATVVSDEDTTKEEAIGGLLKRVLKRTGGVTTMQPAGCPARRCLSCSRAGVLACGGPGCGASNQSRNAFFVNTGHSLFEENSCELKRFNMDFPLFSNRVRQFAEVAQRRFAECDLAPPRPLWVGCAAAVARALEPGLHVGSQLHCPEVAASSFDLSQPLSPKGAGDLVHV